jgi:hypothetical protein
MWIWTDDIGCCHDEIERAKCIGNDVTGSFHDQFDVLCELEQMIEYDVMN